MVDYLTEIPLPGRTFVAGHPAMDSGTGAVTMPAFVAGSENRLPAHALHRLIESAPAERTARSLPAIVALFGPSGVGKTHLAHGLVRHWQVRLGDSCAQYLTANDFRRTLQDHIRREAVVEFRQKFRNLQLLTIDDLHLLPNDSYLMQELRYTIDAYEENGALLIITSTRAPVTLSNLSPDIRSRIAGGLLLPLAVPSRAAKVRLIHQALLALDRSLPNTTVERLALGLTGAVPQIFTVLFELFAILNRSTNGNLYPVEQFLATRTARQPTIREIIAHVAKHCGLPQKQLRGSSRKQAVVFARGLVSFLARNMAGASYEQIGHALGGRDHTTIMHGYHKMCSEYQTDPHTRQTIEELRDKLLAP